MKASIILPLTAAVCICAAGILENRASDWIVGRTVYTTSGPVSGHPAKNQSAVSEYLGIPFAQPPIGDLRFAAPANYTGNKPLNGTIFVGSRPRITIAPANRNGRAPIVRSKSPTLQFLPQAICYQQTSQVQE